MKNKILFIVPFLLFVSGCQNKKEDNNDYEEEKITYYAFFMNNYPRAVGTAVSGYDEKMDNSLYLRQEIEIGKPFNKPAEDPTRNNYLFQGWFKEKSCVNEWDFSKDVSNSSVYLYAKWMQEGSEEYMEPAYVYPEKIITNANYRVTGILNMPVIDGVVNLSKGALNRLDEHKDDVSFAVNYERKIDVNLTVATYNPSEHKIHLEVSSGETFDITVNDVSPSLTMSDVSSTYEAKAEKYETLGTKYENYHIALGGSSSMENWSTSTIDMSPIVTFNHGIGGTTVQQWTDKLFQRLILPYSPKAVVYYVGVNNIINGDKESGKDTGEHLIDLFDKTHQYLPNSQIFYVLINSLPGFPSYQNHFDDANNIAIEYAKNHKYLRCIDAGKGLLKEDGTPNASYFVSDGLHMSKYGYVIWGAAVKEAIKNWLDE